MLAKKEMQFLKRKWYWNANTYISYFNLKLSFSLKLLLMKLEIYTVDGNAFLKTFLDVCAKDGECGWLPFQAATNISESPGKSGKFLKAHKPWHTMAVRKWIRSAALFVSLCQFANSVFL